MFCRGTLKMRLQREEEKYFILAVPACAKTIVPVAPPTPLSSVLIQWALFSTSVAPMTHDICITLPGSKPTVGMGVGGSGGWPKLWTSASWKRVQVRFSLDTHLQPPATRCSWRSWSSRCAEQSSHWNLPKRDTATCLKSLSSQTGCRSGKVEMFWLSCGGAYRLAKKDKREHGR